MVFKRNTSMGVMPVNKGKMLRIGIASAVRRGAALLALAAAAALQIGVTAPAWAVDPMMHSSASVESNLYGVWGDNFTCGTCHKSTLTAGNAKAIAPVVQGKPVNFTTYLSYGEDTGHTTSDKICEVCHTQTSHHRYDNSVNGANHHNTVNCTGCHKHNKGFRKGLSDSPGGEACDGCHSDLYVNTYGWGMHATSQISYKHFMENALTEDPTGLNGEKVGTSWYATDVPNGTDAATIKARRCLMCHVDHDQFNKNRAANLRPNATKAPRTGGVSRDDTLCLSCHNDRKTKAYMGPNGEATVLPIPYPTITYDNATTVLNNTTHGYAIESTYRDGSKFSAICSKCHNDSIGRNGENWKSFVGGLGYGQRSTFKFGEHNSTVPGRLAIFSNEFYQRVPGDGTTLTLLPGEQSISIGPTSPGWAADLFKGHYLVVTAGGGSNQRTLITSNTDNKLYVQTWPTGISNGSSFDVVDDNISIDNTCFNCHSRSGQGKPTADDKDWYGQASMSSLLSGIYDLFVGDSGIEPASITHKTSVTVYLKLGTWNATTGSSTNIVGYTLKVPGGRRTITGISAPVASGNATYPYSYTISFSGYLNSTPGDVTIVKPSSHPLDTFSRHESDERSDPGIGWNAGDQGTTTGVHLTTGATQITDSSKSWSGAEFAGQKITFPGLFDASGKQLSSIITGGGQGTVIFNPAVDGLNADGGDNYFLGNRHVSCADCHNPHASFKNPEGTISGTPTQYNIADSAHVNVPGWYDGIWNGYLLKVRTAGGAEQIRFIKGFVKATGTYTVSLPFNTVPAAGDRYEVLMGDKWTALGQSGGRAGSGSSGMWGIIPTGWRTPKSFGNMTGVSGVRRIENAFDNLSSTGLRGSTIAGQRDMCIRCHSSFAFEQAPPMTPSVGPGTTSQRSTDIFKEFNPANQAHHAVYSRGRNQPITATGNVAGAKSSYNPYWPAYGAVAAAPYSKSNLGAANDTTKTVSVNTSGVATFSGGDLPRTVLPGWFIYINTAAGGTAPAGTALAQGATKGWFEVVTVDSPTQLTLSPKPTANFSGSYFKLTAGLGNNFVPPYGPWSILRCTDCHGSTKTDPVGPHASVNKWLLKSLDTTLSFDWYDGSATIATRTPNNGATAAIFCFNCHRRDVYGDSTSYADKTAGTANAVAYRSFSRAAHAGPTRTHPDGLNIDGMINNDSGNILDTATLTWGDGIFCRHCHAGDKLGGMHGTNAVATQTSAPNSGKGQGKRFLNGATWTGYNMPTTGVVTCYTQTSGTSVSSCAPGAVKSASANVLYNYTGARY